MPRVHATRWSRPAIASRIEAAQNRACEGGVSLEHEQRADITPHWREGF